MAPHREGTMRRIAVIAIKANFLIAGSFLST
jgi:hypothetical protein